MRHALWCFFAITLTIAGCADPVAVQRPTSNDLTAVNALQANALSPVVDLALYGVQSNAWSCSGTERALAGATQVTLAFPWRTFGTRTDCLKTLLNKPEVKGVEIYLVNETCVPVRGRICGPLDFLSKSPNYTDPLKYTSLLRARDPKLLADLTAHFAAAAAELMPLITAQQRSCWIAPGLESNVNDLSAARLLVQLARAAFPRCDIVWNPVSPPSWINTLVGTDHVLYEAHGTLTGLTNVPSIRSQYQPARCIYNNDGTNIDPANFGSQIRAYAACSTQFYWQVSFNCVDPNNSGAIGGPGFVLPPARTACPSAAQQQAVVSALRAARTGGARPAPAPRWDQPGGAMHSGPAVASWGKGRFDVFYVGAAGDLRWRRYDGAWRSESSLGGMLTSDPAAVSWGDGRLDVFARGIDNALWHLYYDQAVGAWSAWESLSGQLAAGPAVASWGKGRLDVFVRGSDLTLWHRWYEGGWSAWEHLDGPLASEPAAVSWGPGRIDVFAQGNDKALIHRYYSGAWSAWESLGGSISSGPTVASRGVGYLDIFTRGDDGSLYLTSWNQTWWDQRFTFLSGQITHHPAAVSWDGETVDAFVRGSDGTLWHWGLR